RAEKLHNDHRTDAQNTGRAALLHSDGRSLRADGGPLRNAWTIRRSVLFSCTPHIGNRNSDGAGRAAGPNTERRFVARPANGGNRNSDWAGAVTGNDAHPDYTSV